jgi:hypothetical protein
MGQMSQGIGYDPSSTVLQELFNNVSIREGYIEVNKQPVV